MTGPPPYAPPARNRISYRLRLAFLAASLALSFACAGTVAGTPATPAPVPAPPLDRRGTVDSPVVVRVVPNEKPESEVAAENEDREAQRASARETFEFDHWLIGIGLLQALIFAFQFVAFAIQAKKLDETVKAAKDQADDMKRSVDHAARGANAMEAVAESMTISARTTT